MRTGSLVIALLATACADDDPAERNAAACAALERADLEGAQVLQAEFVRSGSYELPDAAGGVGFAADVPAFCRVTGSAAPVTGSRIGFEVWLPMADWNGRLLMLGNGGYSSSMPYPWMVTNVSNGYVSVATDTGHDGDDPVFARNAPESIADWGHRAVHVSVRHAKALTQTFYERAPQWSYFAGCSTGGHQALMSAQRYPDDFDGIIAGAPGHNRTHLNAGFLWQYLSNHRPETGEPILSAEKLPLISAAVLESCRANNGTISGGLADDSYLDDPLACEFDPQTLQCHGVDYGDCLTPGQVEVVNSIYDGPRDPDSGERIYFGQLPGSEAAGGPPTLPGWSLYWADPRRPDQPARSSFWQYWVLGGAEFDPWSFDFGEGVRLADERLAETINAMDPDLSLFRDRGGKLLHYHGLNDPVVPATDSISYHDRVRRELGNDTGDFYRLFLLPGVEHCRGGPGPDSFDPQSAIEAWVERGEAPDDLIATHRRTSGDKKFTRPLCPYPEYAEYRGSGSTLEAESFDCRSRLPRPDIPTIGVDYLR